MELTIDCKLSFHRIRAHLLSTESFGVVIHVVQVVLSTSSIKLRKQETPKQTYFKFSITHNCTSVLNIQVLLICNASTHPFLTQHFAQCHGIIVGIDSDNVTRFAIVCFEVLQYKEIQLGF